MLSSKHSLRAEPSEYYKVVRIYIKTLREAEPEGDHFVYANKRFLHVYLVGTIVSKFPYKDKICLKVNDNVNSIICMMENHFLNKIEQQKIKYEEDSDPFEGDTSTAVFQASQITYMATKYLAKHIPSGEDLGEGKTVAITGKLMQRNGKRYVFVNKINVAEIEDILINIQYQLHTYTHEYPMLAVNETDDTS